MDKQKEGILSLPGLGFEKDMMELLNDGLNLDLFLNSLCWLCLNSL